jgi:hypothetical protein
LPARLTPAQQFQSGTLTFCTKIWTLRYISSPFYSKLSSLKITSEKAALTATDANFPAYW